MKTRFITIGLSVILLSACNSKQEDESTAVNTQQAPVVTAVATSTETYTPELEFTATAHPNKEANLGASLPGRVEKIYYNEGQNVKKGDLLVKMSAEMFTQAMVEYTTIKKDFERVSRLLKKGSISEQKFDHVKARMDASEAKTSMLKKNTEIRAPFSGTVVEHLVQEGENYLFSINLDPSYSMTSGILRLMQLDPIKLSIEVNERDLPSITTGMEAQITMDAYPNQLFNGKVKNIKPMLSTLTRTATVEVEVRNPKKLIMPGMSAKASLMLSEQEGIFIPINAVIRQAGTSNNYVYVVENNHVKKVAIQQNKIIGDRVMVSGLTTGQRVITNGKNKLHDGMQVKLSK